MPAARTKGEILHGALSKENVELARTATAALNRGDLDAFLRAVHPDVEFRSLIAELEGRAYKGHQGVREWWSSVARSLGGLRFELDEIRDAGDTVIVRQRIIGTVEGVEVPQTMWQVIRVREGRASWWEIFRTETEALEAAGLSEQDAHTDF